MSKEKRIVTMDGNEAAAYVAYAFTEVAAIYPITPSSPMAEYTDEWSAKGKKNIFGQPVTLVEMQSEAGAVGAVHGALETGSLATSYTASQGLMLMIPTMHRISGQRHPGVLHVAARTVGTHAFSIFGDHSDVMNCRQTGFAMLCSGSVQECMDLAGVAHLSAIKGATPFMHFFDGFRTSHEINKIEALEYEDLAALVDRDALRAFRDRAINPEHPVLRSTVQNPDVYFQIREATNKYYDDLPGIVEDYMNKINAITGRDYKLFNYYGAPDATDVVIGMGSVSGIAQEMVDYLMAQGRKVGYLQVHLYRPFSVKHFLKELPETVQRIAVLDRCKEHGAVGEPLYEDVRSAFYDSGRSPMIIGGRYGLSSKDTDPAQLKAVYDNLVSANPINSFTIGINDDVTHLSLPLEGALYPDGENCISCKFWGLGGDGTVGANKSSITIISEHTDKYVQAYFEYDAKKTLGVTKSHLRFGDQPIRSAYYVKQGDFIACHNQTYITKYDIVSELKEGGTFLLNCSWTPEELETKLPNFVKRDLALKKANFYIIDATAISQQLGLGTHTNMELQSAFFKLANIIPIDDAVRFMKEEAYNSYFTKGDDVVNKNYAAIDAGLTGIVKIDVPAAWADLEDDTIVDMSRPAFVREICDPINNQKGDDLPVSAFMDQVDGSISLGLTAYEKRSLAVKVPRWDSTKCIQCNKCSYVCPHAVIRPYLLSEEETAAAPDGFITVDAKGKQAAGLKYTMQVSAADCTGCGSCASVCPAGALTMVPLSEELGHEDHWEYGLNLSDKGDLFDPWTVKGSQFRQPLCEFSAACAGCGETPYAKLLTQLFGDRVYWANATGCSQAWGAAMPGIPYTTNKKGKGPAYSNSLFEDNAEFSLGMLLSVNKQRDAQKLRAEKLAALCGGDIAAACNAWIEGFDDFNASVSAGEALCAALEAAELDGEAKSVAADILANRDHLSKKTFWMYGGDGWAYDIGFGGLDHVISTGENINVFVIDTEVYSNTGGQSSKATPVGAVAQFQSSGKKSVKKDMGAIFMSYGNVYVAQVAMGADNAQLVKAIKEAEAYNGPSIIIAYCPCSAHGIKKGMANAQDEMKRAVDSGYWFLYRYNPENEKPFTLDSKEPTMDYEEFLKGETRYAALELTFPENAKELFAIGKKAAKAKYEKLRKMAE